MSNLFVPIKKAELDWRQGMPFSIQYNDIYNAAGSGMEHSRYVFIDGNNLIRRWQDLPRETSSLFTIAETGFGTGLNFLLSWFLWEQYAPKSARLHFISCEKHPLSLDDLIKSLVFWPKLEEQAKQLIASYPPLTPGYHHLCFDDGRVTLTLMLGDALECYEQLLICGESGLERELRTSFIDAWYLDGFAPAKNKSMWSDDLMKIIALLSKKGTTLATYTAAATVKKNLSQYGFIIEKKKGFGPKWHMISASLNPAMQQSIRRCSTPWHVSRPEIHTVKSAIIIGAGLAGCFTAYSLAKKGWKITLIDELNEVGQAASANQQAVLFPKLSAYNSPLTQFMLMAFLYAARTYQSILKQAPLGELNGSLLLAHNSKEQLAQASLQDWLAYYPELATLVDETHATEIAGVPLTQSGLFIPLSGWINSPLLCQFLASTEGISLVTNTPIKRLFFDGNWIVNDWKADVLILTGGHKVSSFKETQHLPVKPIRGQMSAVFTSQQSFSLKVPLCGDGHVLPAFNHLHQFGATYELKTDSVGVKNSDDLLNLAKLKKLAPEVTWSAQIAEHWAGIRAATPDYLPLVGRVAMAHEFTQLFSGLETNAKRWIPHPGAYYPGLYVCSGFGSRGLTTIPLSAEWLASLINNEIGCLPRAIQQALAPARFLRKNIILKKNNSI